MTFSGYFTHTKGCTYLHKTVQLFCWILVRSMIVLERVGYNDDGCFKIDKVHADGAICGQKRVTTEN